jgi:uncharacterized protein YbjQ (UPF0145 family)
VRHGQNNRKAGWSITTWLTTEVADFFGRRFSAFAKRFREAKRHTDDALKSVAAEQGAHAVISIDMDFSESSGIRVALILNGALIKLEPIE